MGRLPALIQGALRRGSIFRAEWPGCHQRVRWTDLHRGCATQSELSIWRPDLAPETVRSIVEQCADAGALLPEQHSVLCGVAATTSGQEDADADEGMAVPCGLLEFVLASEACAMTRFRDYVLMAQMAERTIPSVATGSHDLVLRLAAAYASLGVLNAPLFAAVARSLLTFWQAAAAEDAPPTLAELTQVARAFAAQRHPHRELLESITEMLAARHTASTASSSSSSTEASWASPPEALSLLHSFCFLRKEADLGELWQVLEAQALAPGASALGPAPIAEFCYILFLSRQDSTRLQDICELLSKIAGQVAAIKEDEWSTPAGLALRQKLLLLRSALRYLHRSAYEGLPEEASQALRHIHRLEVPEQPKPVVSFVRKLSHILTKLRIGHLCNAMRGPLLLDIVERDRKLIYECNHFDRFYNGTTQKIASMCLQERIVKAMGYRVVQVPHWQWSKLRHKRQRTEYVRMSRYYAIKDRREWAPRDDPSEDLCVNELDFQGEYFFRKDRPSSPWSWFQPTYDASRRLRSNPHS